MKYILLFIILLISGTVKGQELVVSLPNFESLNSFPTICDTTKLLTVKSMFIIGDTTRKWNYYNKNGVLKWGGVSYLDSSLLSSGGYIEEYYVHPEVKRVIGFIVWKTHLDCSMEIYALYGADMKPIKKSYAIVIKPPFPIEGF